jgi:hypothetical protein
LRNMNAILEFSVPVLRRDVQARSRNMNKSTKMENVSSFF